MCQREDIRTVSANGSFQSFLNTDLSQMKSNIEDNELYLCTVCTAVNDNYINLLSFKIVSLKILTVKSVLF